ncbi:uncharacterized protein KY384_002377 [Bacidia gigantensis]|uniref:uncharacterized protein n=1 Tax=Bacidia gigantensis TaxID=2732470 RepID=UPI001D03CE9A|nr:uncharacterized protein KY384_002377 [Bacidia gigantensis]KAG8532500.1 hypothetical protein KY384_002377 [Bacidia gigantensis]
MRLLNTHSIELQDFIGSSVPKYSILSHTWGEQEVSFADFSKCKNEGSERFKKIENACIMARLQDSDWIWIDTCCIDKSSSAELSEAINSMYRWYEMSTDCLVYLEDVKKEALQLVWLSQFSRSRWFTRGWTLQELLAPDHVTFFDRDWAQLGTKHMFVDEISTITGIPPLAVRERKYFRYSVAQKMSWASGRQTTRMEDRAYCLFGLFDINMSLLYGEGENAFIRLQYKILKSSTDESIFAWASNDTRPGTNIFLARSPAYFAGSGDIIRELQSKPYCDRSPYSRTNLGLQFEIRRLAADGNDCLTQPTTFPSLKAYDLFAPICCRRDSLPGTLLVLFFKQWTNSARRTIAYRVHMDKLENIQVVSNASQKDLVCKALYINDKFIFYSPRIGPDDPVWVDGIKKPVASHSGLTRGY